MTQRRGVHRILEFSLVYNFVQKLFAHEPTQIAWDRLIGEKKTGLVLDVGCGPGNRSKDFSSSKKYVGIDISEKYISDAREKFDDFGEFEVLSSSEIDRLPYDRFDLVILRGVLHHLSDTEVTTFFKKVRNKLSSTGVLVTLDPTYERGRPLANFIVSLDRGMNIRKCTDLVELCANSLSVLEQSIIPQHFPPYQRVLLKLGKCQN